MPKKDKAVTSQDKKSVSELRPRSAEFAQRGIQTSSDFAGMMSALMSDVIEGAVPPQVANATVNAGGKLLKLVEMQLKYGNGKPEDVIAKHIGPPRN